MTRLADAVSRLDRAQQLEHVQEIVRITARRVVGADGATLVLREGNRCYYADEDSLSPLWKGQRFPLAECISGWSIVHREAVIIDDIRADERIPHAAYRPTYVRSLAVVPIRVEDPIGAIGVYWAGPHRASGDEMGLLAALASAAGTALERIVVSAPSPR